METSTPKQDETNSTPKQDETKQGVKTQELSEVKPTEPQGTTAKLFPEFSSEAPKSEETPKVEEKPKETPKPEEEVLTLDSLKGKKVKVNIDGEEKIVSAEEVWKGYQTDQHLSKKGQSIGDERRQLVELRSQLDAEKARLETSKALPINQPNADNPWTEELKPFITPLQAELDQVRNELNSLKGSMAPINYQRTVDNLDSQLATEGFKDFKTYLPKVEEYILGMPKELQKNYDNALGFATVYKHLKANDMMVEIADLKKANSSKPIAVEERAKPSVVVESGSNTQTGTSPSDAKYKDAFANAQRTGDWSEVFKLKGL